MPKEISGLMTDCPLCNWLLQTKSIKLTDNIEEVTCKNCLQMIANETKEWK